MIQFTVFFFAVFVVGVFFIGFYLLQIARWVLEKVKFAPQEDLTIHIKGNLVCNSSDILTHLNDSEKRNKRVYGEKFPSNSLPRFKNPPPPPEPPKDRIIREGEIPKHFSYFENEIEKMIKTLEEQRDRRVFGEKFPSKTVKDSDVPPDSVKHPLLNHNPDNKFKKALLFDLSDNADKQAYRDLQDELHKQGINHKVSCIDKIRMIIEV